MSKILHKISHLLGALIGAVGLMFFGMEILDTKNIAAVIFTIIWAGWIISSFVSAMPDSDDSSFEEKKKLAQSINLGKQ